MNAEGLAFQLVSRIEELNAVCSHLVETDYGVYRKGSLPLPRLNPAELGFMRSVSWLYVQYHETGKVGTQFLTEKLQLYKLDPAGRLRGHPTIVRQLRTYFQHDLNPGEQGNNLMREKCETWMNDSCGTRTPGSEDHWAKCLWIILSDAAEFVGTMILVARSIEVDESRDAICDQWKFRLERYHSPYEFDRLIAEVAKDIGREHIDPIQVRKRFYEKWVAEMILLEANYDFETEARKRIENVLLVTPILPITGKDVMAEFGLVPGPEVGKLLQRAHVLYSDSPCSREVLLQRLSSETSSQ